MGAQGDPLAYRQDGECLSLMLLLTVHFFLYCGVSSCNLFNDDVCITDICELIYYSFYKFFFF